MRIGRLTSLLAVLLSLSALADETEVRVGVAGGLTSLSSPSSNETQTQNIDFRESIYVGVTGDMRWKYLGFDLEGFYGAGAVDRTGGTGIQRQLITGDSLSQFGGLLNVKGQLPFTTGTVRWVPKVGIGYGLQSLSLNRDFDTYSSDNLAGVGVTEKVNGLYLVAGLEVEPVSSFFLWGDYAFSVAASSDLTFDGKLFGSPVPVSLPSDSASFDRLRIGALLRIVPHLMLGLQYTMRHVNMQFLGLSSRLIDTQALQPTQFHYLGVLLYEL